MPRSFAARTASKARPAASAPASRAMKSAPLRVAQILSCSIAAARNVSPAASMTERPSARNFAASLPIVVVLPEPLTPATRMTNGFFAGSMTSGCATGASAFSTSAATTALISSGVIAVSRSGRSASSWRCAPRCRCRDRRGPAHPRSHRSSPHRAGAWRRRSRDGAAERRRAAFEAAGEAPPPRLLGFGGFAAPSIDRLAEFLACGARDSRFAKVGKHDPGRDGVAAPLSRRADAGDRQAGRHGRASRLTEQQGSDRESVEDHFDALRFGLPRPPALAHRLDRDTSGCLVLGRHRKALAQLGKLFQQRRDRQDLLGHGRRRAGRRRRRNRHAARPPRRNMRLVAEARSGGPAGGDQVEGDGALHRA